VKFLTPQLTYLLTQGETRRNLKVLFQYLGFLTATIAAYSVIFHVLMIHEGQDHSWLTGLYWTLTVMSTLGFGDITFHSDLGRLFSMVVLLSGLLLLLILLPFVFIRFFYAPWLEAQLRLRAPREAPPEARDHVILCRYDVIARALIERLRDVSIPYYVIEPDPAVAASLHAEGVSAVAGEVDSSATYEALRAGQAKLLVANLGDAANSNIALTVRESWPDLPIAAFAEDKDSVDILELSGVTEVFPLKHRLGEYLASRVAVGPAHAHVVGGFEDLLIAEFPVEHTGLAGRTIRDTRLRELTGLNVVACWERGRLLPARHDTRLSEHSVAVVVGTQEQITELDAMFVIYEPDENPVLLIGGGKVGRAAARALKQRGVTVNLIERDASLHSYLQTLADGVFIGDAANFEVMMEAGLETAPSVLLTTNDDATNIFLAVYCRRLNPSTRIVSRVVHDRNLDAIHRAGADSVLSYPTLGAKALLARILDTHASFVGEGVDLFVEAVPDALVGKPLADSGIGADTGLNVICVQRPDGSTANALGSTELGAGDRLVMLGATEQRESFRRAFA
jgi:Trk K+ transport system NAD-binding subunit